MLSPGESVSITGTGWPAHRLLQAAVCGGGPLAVSSECDLTHAIEFGSADNGVVAASLTASVPPAPCPCVILVTQVNPSATESLPVTIEGAPTGSIPTPFPARPSVRVFGVEVVSQSSWTSWFGAAAPRELVVTVHNRGSLAVRPLLVASWIDGSDNYVITSPRPKRLRAGGTTQLTAPFSLSTFANGQFVVVGTVTGTGFDDRFSNVTATTPWGLYILLILLAVGVLLAVAAFLGRRRAEQAVEFPVPPDRHDQPTAQLSTTGAAQ